MGAQTLSQIIMVLGIVLTAAGGFGSYWFGRIESKEQQQKSDDMQRKLHAELSKLQATYDANTKILFEALNIRQNQWVELTIETVPSTSAYLLLLFRSNKGRINGKVRVKGTEMTYSFSTTANDAVPVAVQNYWLTDKKEYKQPIILELAVTGKTDQNATLNILTQGWIDDLGQEPHQE